MKTKMICDRRIGKIGLRVAGQSIDDLDPDLRQQLIRQGLAVKIEAAPKAAKNEGNAA